MEGTLEIVSKSWKGTLILQQSGKSNGIAGNSKTFQLNQN